MLDYLVLSFFFFNDTATTEIYTLSLHDALPISDRARLHDGLWRTPHDQLRPRRDLHDRRSEEHTSELQSHSDLVCRLLLEKKKRKQTDITNFYKYYRIITPYTTNTTPQQCHHLH